MKSRESFNSGRETNISENPVYSLWFNSRWFLLIAFLLWLTAIVTNGMVDDWGRLSNGGENLVIFIEESLWPPDWSVLEPQSYPPCITAPGFQFTCSTAWIGVVETLKWIRENRCKKQQG